MQVVVGESGCTPAVRPLAVVVLDEVGTEAAELVLHLVVLRVVAGHVAVLEVGVVEVPAVFLGEVLGGGLVGWWVGGCV